MCDKYATSPLFKHHSHLFKRCFCVKDWRLMFFQTLSTNELLEVTKLSQQSFENVYVILLSHLHYLFCYLQQRNVKNNVCQSDNKREFVNHAIEEQADCKDSVWLTGTFTISRSTRWKTERSVNKRSVVTGLIWDEQLSNWVCKRTVGCKWPYRDTSGGPHCETAPRPSRISLEWNILASCVGFECNE